MTGPQVVARDSLDASSAGVPETRTTQRRDVQGLRAVAVLAVVADHLLGWPQGGFVGVDVFFVVSGYLITGLLLREHARTGSISFRGFYARRARRILPNAALTLAATVLVTGLLVGGVRAVTTAVDAVWAALCAANWRFALTGTDYFQEGLPPSPVQHFWSLSVEEQFYFVWPWVMLLLLALVRHRSRERAQRALVGAAMGVVVVASFAWALHQTGSNPSFAFFSSLGRVWELGAGALVAILGSAVVPRSGVVRRALSWVGLLGILAALLVVRADHGFPAPWAALPVAATALVLLAGHGSDEDGPWPLTNRASGYVGDMSYSLYLWHWPVLILLPTVMLSGSKKFDIVALTLAFVLAIAAYHLVESPARRSGPAVVPGTGFVRRYRRPFVAGVVMLAVLGGSSWAVLASVASTAQSSASEGPHDSPGSPQGSCDGAAAWAPGAECEDAVYASSVTPDPSEMVDDTGGAFSCYTAAKKPLKSCTFGRTEGETLRVALVGDSHAAMLLPGLRDQLDATGWRLDTYVGNGCQLREKGPKATQGNCDTAMKEILAAVDAGQYDLILTAGARTKAGSDASETAERYSAAWQPLIGAGASVIAVSDTPVVTEAALQCVGRVGFRAGDDCGMTLREGASVPDPLVAAVAATPGSALADVTRFYCDDTGCPAVIGNQLVYRDTVGHLTGTYSRSLGPYLVGAIERALKSVRSSG